MCPPAVLTFALSAATQVMAFRSQQEQAKAQYKTWQDSIQASTKALNDQMAQEDTRVQQEQAVAVDKKLDLYREAKRAKGEALASSESGGISEELLLADVERQRASYTDSVAINLKNQLTQSYWNKKGMVSDALSRINANQPTTSGGSVLGLGLGLAGSALPVYEDFHIRSTKGDVKTVN